MFQLNFPLNVSRGLRRSTLCTPEQPYSRAHAAFAHELKTLKEDELKASSADKECAGGGELKMVEKEQDQAATASSERRSEARIKACHSALLRMPNAHPIEGWLLDASSTGVGLRIPGPVPVGVAVRVDAQKLLLFGTVTHCEQTDGAYRVGIKLSRSLETLAELKKLNESIFIEPEPA